MRHRDGQRWFPCSESKVEEYRETKYGGAVKENECFIKKYVCFEVHIDEVKETLKIREKYFRKNCLLSW